MREAASNGLCIFRWVLSMHVSRLSGWHVLAVRRSPLIHCTYISCRLLHVFREFYRLTYVMHVTDQPPDLQPVIRLYAVPLSAFAMEEDEENVGLEVEEAESS